MRVHRILDPLNDIEFSAYLSSWRSICNSKTLDITHDIELWTPRWNSDNNRIVGITVDTTFVHGNF